MNIHRILLLLVVATLTACATGGVEPRSTEVDAARLSLGKAGEEAGALVPWPEEEWWRAYGDPQLDSLVAEALAGSPFLQVARARVDKALALAGAADAARSPRVDADLQLERQRFSEHDVYPPPYGGSTWNSGRLALDFSYEFDFWGRNRDRLEAALTQAEAARADAYTARLLLAVAVTRSYMEFDRLLAQRDIALALQRDKAELNRLQSLRREAGLDSDAELKQAAASLAAAQSDVAALDVQIALVRHQLAALLGKGPDRGDAIAPPSLSLSRAPGLPTVLPAELLGRRPDVMAQKLRAEAASKELAAAKADFYPNVNLAAFLGAQALGLGQLLKAGSGIAGVGPALSLPLFDGGRRRANLALRTADYDAAVEQYNLAVLMALRDVADTLATWRGVETQRFSRAAALADLEAHAGLVAKRQAAGLTSRMAVIEAESRALAMKQALTDLDARRMEASVNLARVLGGGYPALAGMDHPKRMN
ncbi:MAG: efflux transporter outer membrane subunit [Sulfuricellaceae bacterium]